MNIEEWRPIPGFGGHYEASDQGRVRMRARVAMRMLNGRPAPVPMAARIRKPSVCNKHGHLKLSLGVDGRTYKRFVHELVLLAFVGPRPAGMEACHRNDVGADNRLLNLRWDTRAGNIADRAPPRRPYPVGAAHAMAKLTDAQVRVIRDYPAGPTATGRIFGVGRHTVANIRAGRSWAHVL